MCHMIECLFFLINFYHYVHLRAYFEKFYSEGYKIKACFKYYSSKISIERGSLMRMNRFTTGMMIGSLIGAASVMMADTNKRERKKMLKNGKKVIKRAGNMMDDIIGIYR